MTWLLTIPWPIAVLLSSVGGRCGVILQQNTVDSQNPTPVDKLFIHFIPLFTGFSSINSIITFSETNMDSHWKWMVGAWISWPRPSKTNGETIWTSPLLKGISNLNQTSILGFHLCTFSGSRHQFLRGVISLGWSQKCHTPWGCTKFQAIFVSLACLFAAWKSQHNPKKMVWKRCFLLQTMACIFEHLYSSIFGETAQMIKDQILFWEKLFQLAES